jgi:tetratricopeptide (TPR) repeat protein
MTESQFTSENLQAEQHISDGNLPEAARILVDIIDKDTQNWRAYNNLGIISWMQQSWEDAYAMFSRSVSFFPAYTDALINLFDAALKLHRIDQVLPIFKKAIESDPNLDEIKVIIQSIEDQGEGIYQSERALMIGSTNPLLEEGGKLLEEGKINEAMAKFLESNDTMGPNAGAFCGLGIVSYYQKRYSDAYSLFLESIKLNPIDPDTFINLLDSAKNCDKVEDAKKIFLIYAEKFPALKSLEKEFENAL